MHAQPAAEPDVPSCPTPPRHRRRRLRWLVVLLAVCAGLLVWLFAEPRAVTVAEYRIGSPDVPAAFDGTRIVFLADIHHGPFLGRGRVRSLVDRVNAMMPDLIVLGGDYVHRSGEYIAPCSQELSRLRAPLGVYAVLGNHDHWEGAGQTRVAMAAAGITLIDNRGVWITRGDARIRLGGVGDLWEDEQLIAPVLQETSRDDFVLLASHNPDYYATLTTLGPVSQTSATDSGAVPDRSTAGDGSTAGVGAAAASSAKPSELVDLVLAGHTHGGQVTLFGLWAPKVPSDYGQRFRSGLVGGAEQSRGTANADSEARRASVPMIVSNGIGTITPPVRFCAPPQIVYVELVRRR